MCMNQDGPENSLHIALAMDRGIRQRRGMVSLVEAGVMRRMVASMVAREGAACRRRSDD
jgi:hypothetical protein